jgi:hypothetical protein
MSRAKSISHLSFDISRLSFQQKVPTRCLNIYQCTLKHESQMTNERYQMINGKSFWQVNR